LSVGEFTETVSFVESKSRIQGQRGQLCLEERVHKDDRIEVIRGVEGKRLFERKRVMRRHRSRKGRG
jgi:hypothetical protein